MCGAPPQIFVSTLLSIDFLVHLGTPLLSTPLRSVHFKHCIPAQIQKRIFNMTAGFLLPLSAHCFGFQHIMLWRLWMHVVSMVLTMGRFAEQWNSCPRGAPCAKATEATVLTAVLTVCIQNRAAFYCMSLPFARLPISCHFQIRQIKCPKIFSKTKWLSLTPMKTPMVLAVCTNLQHPTFSHLKSTLIKRQASYCSAACSTQSYPQSETFNFWKSDISLRSCRKVKQGRDNLIKVDQLARITPPDECLCLLISV